MKTVSERQVLLGKWREKLGKFSPQKESNNKKPKIFIILKKIKIPIMKINQRYTDN